MGGSTVENATNVASNPWLRWFNAKRPPEEEANTSYVLKAGIKAGGVNGPSETPAVTKTFANPKFLAFGELFSSQYSGVSPLVANTPTQPNGAKLISQHINYGCGYDGTTNITFVG